MNFGRTTGHSIRRRRSAFTLMEVLISVLILGGLFAAFCATLHIGVAMITVARQNLRATQIMVERMEGIRLFNWGQLTNTDLLPATFTDYYYPPGTNNGTEGIIYHGTVTLAQAPLDPPASYDAAVKEITVRITWTGVDGMVHQRSMSTYQARYGVQNYVFGQ